MLVAPHYTESFRLQELERGRRSLFYFGYSILGFDAYDPRRKKSTIAPIHRDLCHFLEGRKPHLPWNRAVVTCFRGAGKSVWTTQAYPWWRGLYIKDFSVKLVENSSDNAKINHFAPMIDLFTSSPRADYLQWLYSHRIPEGFRGWNRDQIKLVQEDPLAAPFMTYWGLESRFEGWHGDLVILDDPEGSDALKSMAANEESYQAYQNVIPLLKDHTHAQILIVATPWGARPLVYRLRRQAGWNQEADNAKTAIKFFWREITDGEGKSRWPARFPKPIIDELRKEPMAAQNYWLKEQQESATIFDMKAVTEYSYRFVEGTAKQQIEYQTFEFNPDALTDQQNNLMVTRHRATAKLVQLRYFLHWDPLHRTEETRRTSRSRQRPAEAAISVVGVAPDFHSFLIDYWTDGDASPDKQLGMLFRFYRIYAPFKVSFEGVGAQIWAKNMVRTYEQNSPVWARPVSMPLILGNQIPLPQMSSRLVESSKTNQEKPEIYREVLSPWVNRGVFHFRMDQDKPRAQLENCLNEEHAVDLVDAISQGPEFWSPPGLDVMGIEFMRRRKYVETFVRGGVAAKTGFTGRKYGR